MSQRLLTGKFKWLKSEYIKEYFIKKYVIIKIVKLVKSYKLTQNILNCYVVSQPITIFHNKWP